MMGGRFNPLDPLGILGAAKRDVDRIGSSVLPGPPGMARRDPLGLFNPGTKAPNPETKIIPYDPSLKIVNIEQLTRGTGARYLEVMEDEIHGVLIAKQWRQHPTTGTLIEFKGKPIGNPIPAHWNGDLIGQKETARQRLVSRGYSEQMVDKALTWYEEWLIGMARKVAPGDDDLQRRVVHSGYEDIAARAEQWMRGIQEAFGIPVPA